ncbi:hypothetical protein C8J56DRAFT_1065712 [Mycena floridula]|nr:hypothetical protein C8J56DRAFT_1065712 [Mycena floridula]
MAAGFDAASQYWVHGDGGCKWPSNAFLEDLGNHIDFFNDDLDPIPEDDEDSVMPGQTPAALERAIATALNPFTTDERLCLDIQRALDNSTGAPAEANPANRKFAAGKEVLSAIPFKRQRVNKIGASKTTSSSSDQDSDDEIQEILRAATPSVGAQTNVPAITQAAAPARATFAAVAAIPYAQAQAAPQAAIAPIAPMAAAIPVVADPAFTPYQYFPAAARVLPLSGLTQPPAPNWPHPEVDPHVLTMNQDAEQSNIIPVPLIAGPIRDMVAGEVPNSLATIQMGPQIAASPPRGAMASPAAWLIQGTVDEDADHMGDLAVLSSGGQALFVLDYDMAMPSFLITLIDFLHQNTPAGLAVLCQAIQDTLMGNPLIRQHNTTFRDQRPAIIPAAQVHLDFVNSIDIRHIHINYSGGQPGNAINVYADFPFSSMSGYMELHRIVTRLRFRTIMIGEGRAIPSPFLCHICRGMDHPTGLCPFPTIPGWLGPTHESAVASSLGNRGGRGRGARGGQRGNRGHRARG